AAKRAGTGLGLGKSETQLLTAVTKRRNLNDPAAYASAHRLKPVAGTVGTPFTYALSGGVMAALKPKQTARGIKQDVPSLVQHPIRYARQNPENALADVWALASLGTSAGLRANRLAAFSRGKAPALKMEPATSARQAVFGRPLATPPIRTYRGNIQAQY